MYKTELTCEGPWHAGKGDERIGLCALAMRLGRIHKSGRSSVLRAMTLSSQGGAVRIPFQFSVPISLTGKPFNFKDDVIICHCGHYMIPSSSVPILQIKKLEDERSFNRDR